MAENINLIKQENGTSSCDKDMAMRDRLILDLLKRYKEAYLSVLLDHNGADELYKWQLITECEGKSELDIIQKFKTKNIVDVARVNQVLTTLSKDQPQQLANNFALLTNEDVPLSDRLSDFKSAMGELCGDKFNVKANDERTASAFLACWNPNKYTFYKDEIYQNYCSYINEPTQKAGNKYPHYLQMLESLVQAIQQDAELTDKFATETDGLVQSDLLIAQNILWQMKDMMKKEKNNPNQNPQNEYSMIPENIRQFTNILRLKKNIILQGAPGTGKTYNTAALALAICGEQIPEDHGEVMRRYEELQKEGRIGFVTFHQSMDYEDFVEGIKPKTENGTVSYEVEDGIFKVISAKARDNFEDSQKTVEILQKQKDIQERMIDFLSDSQENTTELKTKTGSKFIIKEVTDKNIIIQIPENQVASQITLRMAELRELLENDVELHKVSDIKAYFHRQFNTQQDSYTFILVNEIRKIKAKPVVIPKTELLSYVLIINEINRGNVSKIFGELITLLEADKRIGGDHPIRVTLPYSKESFGVPSNLYIIGTMNTTDRSVGNIDYAVRRRFAFATLKADRELVEQNSILEAVTLFDAVESFIKKHKIDMDFEDLMVGHSFFFAKDEYELELKWQYEILPLLNEYIKDGIINAKAINSDMTVADFVGIND